MLVLTALLEVLGSPTAQADPASAGSTRFPVDGFVRQGLPAAAVARVSRFLEQNAGRAITITRKDRTGLGPSVQTVQITVRDQFAAIIDYSRPSHQKRFYLLNLVTGTARKLYVAHGQNSGVRYATHFSNIQDSLQSSLGVALTGESYYGFHNKSVALHGLDASNSNMDSRDIVLHGADFASEIFLKKFGRLGRSWGCPTVDPKELETIVSALGVGSVIYFYHGNLMNEAKTTPLQQVLENPAVADDENIDLPGEESDLQARR